MEKKTWNKPEIMTVLTKDTEGGQSGDHLDLSYPDGTPKGDLTFS